MTDNLPDPDLARLLSAAWGRQRERVLARLEVVADALAQVAGGGPAPAGAVEHAHVLAGALGTYGRPGSPLLREAELLLARGAGDAGDAGDLERQVRALRASLD